MYSFLAKLRHRYAARIAAGYIIVGLLIVAVTFVFIDNYVLNAPRPPFAGAEVDPDSLGPTLDQPPTPAAVQPAPTIPDEANNASRLGFIE
jgi:hypothetical protein